MDGSFCSSVQKENRLLYKIKINEWIIMKLNKIRLKQAFWILDLQLTKKFVFLFGKLFQKH